MQSALQPFATAGVAIVGTSLIAVTPLAASPPDLPDVQSRAVQLTAGDAWTDVFNEAHANATQLIQNFGLAPFVGMQQNIVNQAHAINEVLSDPSNITSVTQEMQEHLKAVSSAFTLLNADSGTVSAVTAHTINSQLDLSGISGGFITAGHSLILSEIGSFLPAGTDLGTVTPILDFLASPASAMFMGFLGPLLAPWVAVGNTISDGNFLDIPASFVGGLLNGADLNLDSLIPAVSGILPSGTVINSIDLALGGLLSTGGGDFAAGNSDADHLYTVFDHTGAVAQSVDPVGGSLFNSLGLNLTLPSAIGIEGPFNIDIPSGAIGPIGAAEEWHQIIGVLLGSGWDGSNANAIAPLIGLEPIHDAGSTAATDALTGPAADFLNSIF